jgi:hypothetical protein
MLFQLHKTGRLLLRPTPQNQQWKSVFEMIQKSIHTEEDFCLFLAQGLMGLIESMYQHHDNSEHMLRTIAICLEILQDAPKLTKEQVLHLWMTVVYFKTHTPHEPTTSSLSSSSSTTSSSTTPLMGIDTQSVPSVISAPTPLLSSSSSSLLSILKS